MEMDIDPYAIQDKWVWYVSKDRYDSNLRPSVWITDGKDVEDYCFYKDEPHEVKMANGNDSIAFFLPTTDEKPEAPKGEFEIVIPTAEGTD